MWNRIDRLCRSGGAFSVVKCAAFAEENISRDIRAKCLFILHDAIDFVDGQKADGLHRPLLFALCQSA